MDGLLSPPVPVSVASENLPVQDTYRAQILVDRWILDAEALQQWSHGAKECVDFLEGKQWSDAEKAEMERLGRPMVTINKINRLFRLVYGYYAQNKTDISFAPADDSMSTEQVADILSKTYLQETKRNKTMWQDALVFQDGLSTGRGFWDIRQNFERNDLGETVGTCQDPFSTYLQHDADEYDIQKHTRVTTSRWASVDEIGATYGEEAAQRVLQVVSGDGWYSFPQNYYWDKADEVTPNRKFGQEGGGDPSTWWLERISHLVDPYRKNIRLLDMQYKVRVRARCFVDLETGDWSLVPDFWDDDRIGKALYHAETLGNPVKVVNRVINRHRWTSLVGDIMIWDDWSPYDWFTIVPFFPYFRRGKTRGMIDDLKDPSREVNKKRSLRVEILGRTANGGWKIHENALGPEQKANLHKFGSTPGFILEWQGDQPWMSPERLDAQPRNLEAQVQEDDASKDLMEISGINESAVGDLDRVQSGKAILARQRQAVVGTRMYFDNWSQSLELKGSVYLQNFQHFYTEERVVREMGSEEGRLGSIIINQRIMSPDGSSVVSRINDVTLGRYTVVVKETPSADTFEATQFEEMLLLFQQLPILAQVAAQTNPGLILDMTTMPRKSEWKKALQAAAMAQQAAPAAGGGGGQPPQAGGPPQAPQTPQGPELQGNLQPPARPNQVSQDGRVIGFPETMTNAQVP